MQGPAATQLPSRSAEKEASETKTDSPPSLSDTTSAGPLSPPRLFDGNSFQVNLLWTATWSPGISKNLSEVLDTLRHLEMHGHLPSLHPWRNCGEEQIYPSNYVASMMLSSAGGLVLSGDAL